MNPTTYMNLIDFNAHEIDFLFICVEHANVKWTVGWR